MSQLQVTARLKIHGGKLAEFKEVASRCMESVRTRDTGTLQYDWFLNNEGTECVVREAYRDSDAVFEHIGNLGDTLAEVLALCDMELEIYGTPTQALIDATAEMAPRIFAPLSISRNSPSDNSP
jgi:quinol monooxygenase YgiN